MENLHLTALRMDSTFFRAREFIRKQAPIIADRTIGEGIRNVARQQKMPKRYAQSLHFEMDGMFLWCWVDFKGEKDEPLDLWFEEGTKRHWIEPVAKKALHWIQEGISRFSRGHYVRGITARHVFKHGTRQGIKKFLKELERETTEFLERTAMK